jgi:protein TonB
MDKSKRSLKPTAMKALLINWENAVNPARNELVFENRNKRYGAFAIRKAYDKDVLLALTFALSLFIFLVGISVVHYWKQKITNNPVPKTFKTIDFAEVTFVHEKPIVTSFPELPRGVQIETHKLVNPTVTPDEMVAEDPIPINDASVTIGASNNKGINTFGNLAPNVVLGPDTSSKTSSQILERYEIKQQPEYPGGIENFYRDVYSKIRYPEDALANRVEGTVPVQFVIEPDGSMSNIKALRNESGLGDETVRVFSSLNKWKPGKDEGKPVRVRYTIMIKFKMQ